MPSSDYTTTGGGLKLKGAKGSGVDKKRKKKKSVAPDSAPPDKDVALRQALEDEDDTGTHVPGELKEPEKTAREGQGSREIHKTETERRHEERRRKRLDDRLKREGVKTHKERVEELNKYLSNLSEHHDMPRIGPG